MMLLAAHARAATLEVTVEGVRNDKGAIRVAVCTPSTFLKQTCEHVGSAPAQPGAVTIRLENVPPGVSCRVAIGARGLALNNFSTCLIWPRERFTARSS